MITKTKRQELRKQAHTLKAKCQIGSNGLTPSVIQNIDEMFNTQELLKIKVNRTDKDDKTIVRAFAEEISKRLNAEVVYIVGTTIILYRYNDRLHQK